MGVGTPENILECISLGVDMFDCVMPTRNGRNGMLFTSEGTINIKNKKWENDQLDKLVAKQQAKIEKLKTKVEKEHPLPTASKPEITRPNTTLEP